ncbi:MAG TPA: cobalamin-independent methionine synthase II family protein [Stellaceae bacterium]|nr:cobalamin-independent methionine synthase II family protein [Stellaceae bacterium]
MNRNTDRMLTTHVGSLPRPAPLVAMMVAEQQGRAVDASAYAEAVRQAVSEVVARQLALGIDIVADGEESKPSFVAYVNQRLGGFELDAPEHQRSSFAGSREHLSFPEFYASFGQGRTPGSRPAHMVCTAPVVYRGQALVAADIANLKAALARTPGTAAFMPAASPASIEGWNRNAHYKSDEEYLFAIAEAMREEYRAIIDAGFDLQIDDPRIVSHYTTTPGLGLAEMRQWAGPRIAALNHALRGIPEERVRHHTCYGINMGPRVHDLELKHIIEPILTIRAGAYSFEAANPRHEHEWRLWETVKLPEGKSLIPGVISHTTVLVEHPELIAERLVRYASLVGRERVIAGGDCGFASHPSADPEVHPSVVWAKFEALVAGARLATKELWGR